MKPILASLTVALLTAATTSSAFADKTRCASVPMGQWMPIEKIIAKAESLGYAVRETGQSKGCWKVKGLDRNGAKISLYFNPASGEIIQ